MSRYAGHVTSGGPSEVRELRDLVIRKCSVGEFDNNAYLLTCRATGEQLLIDAAADAPRLQAFVAEGTGLAGSSPLTATLTTSGRSSSWPLGPGRRPPRGPTTLLRCRWPPTEPWSTATGW